MSLDSDKTGGKIKTFLESLTPAQKNDIGYIWKGIVDILYEDIKTDAEVSTTVTGTNDPATNDVTGNGSGGVN